MNTISVIIPVYNAEKYLCECLDSVISAAERVDIAAIELVCVDDGSTDGSAEILREYAARNSCITVITQENQGPGVARNTGLAAAKGEYITFIDADDRLTGAENLKAAYDYAENKCLDVLVLGSNSGPTTEGGGWQDNHFLKFELVPHKGVLSPKEFGVGLFMFCNLAPWAKLYRREFVLCNHLKFPPLMRSEDFPFVMASLLKAMRIGVLDIPLCDHRCGIGTSLESTKDASPCTFLEASECFCKMVDMQHQPDDVRRAYRVSKACRYVYNLRHVKKYSSFLLIVQNLVKEREEFFVRVKDCEMPCYADACEFINNLRLLSDNEDALLTTFVDILYDLKRNASEKTRYHMYVERMLELKCKEINELKNSFSYRLGLCVTWPMRMVYRMLLQSILSRRNGVTRARK